MNRVHDSRVHATAQFSHSLYAQHVPQETPGWWGGFVAARAVMDETLGAGLVDADATLWNRELHGALPNDDVWV